MPNLPPPPPPNHGGGYISYPSDRERDDNYRWVLVDLPPRHRVILGRQANEYILQERRLNGEVPLDL